MDKKIVIAELDYIFNLVKGNFNPQALAKYLTAAGGWNKFMKDKAKSYGIKLDPKFNIEVAVRSQVGKKINDFESEKELVEEWVLAYLLLPEALQDFDYTDEDGKPHWKWKQRSIESIFDSFSRVVKENPENDNFAGWATSAITGTINKYLAFEKKDDAPFITEENDSGVKNKMDKELGRSEKEYTQRHKQVEEKNDHGESYGIAPGDMDKIQSLGDFRDGALFKELRSAVKKYVKEHASANANMVLRLRLLDEHMPVEEIAEKIKKDRTTILSYLKELEKVILDFARKEDNAELVGLLERLSKRIKSPPKDKKESSVQRLASIVDALEKIFPTVPEQDAVKIASITQYINVLCSKIS
jgi:hypothetical protein